VFARDEVETIISAPIDKVPADRRVMYAIMFLGAVRFARGRGVDVALRSGVLTARQARGRASSGRPVASRRLTV
jgi:hypothetical protein